MAQYDSPGMEHAQQQGYSYSRGTDNDDAKGLYVGNLDPKVNDALLWEVFTTAGAVESCKIIKDKVFGESAGYGFVDFYSHDAAATALQNLNGKTVYDKEIKVNWASHSTNKEDANHFNIFVGDLSPEVNDESLNKAFQPYGSITDARVMWDQSTGRSRGYGFVAFREKSDAEQAMTQMNGAWLGNRAIRCNWANQKSSGSTSSSNTTSRGSTSNSNYSDVTSQSTSNNSTVYVGNLPTSIADSALLATFQNYGTIEEIRVQKGKGYGFVKFQTHEQAARAIVAANETTIEGRPIRCSWGKERTNTTPSTPTAAAVPTPSQMYGYYPGQYPAQNYPMYNAMPYYNQQYYPQTYPDPNYYAAQGYDPYAAAYAGYQPQYPQQPQHGQPQYPQQPQQPPQNEYQPR